MNTKSTVDSIASSFEMVAFAIPKAGVFIAGGIAVVKGLFDIFYPTEKKDPGSLAVNVRQFKTAMTDMKNFIDKDVTRIVNKEARLQRLAKGITYLNTLEKLIANPKQLTPELWSEDGAYTEADIVQWKKKLERFSEPLTSDDNPFLETLNWLDLKPENQNDNLEMYLYFINLYMHYAKLAMTWQSQIAFSEYQLKLQAYNKIKNGHGDEPGFGMKLKIWRMKEAKHPGSGGQKPTLPAEVLKPLKENFGIHSQYAQNMVLDIPQYVAKVKSVIKTARENWNKREDHIINGLAEFRVYSRVASEFTGTTFVKDFFTFGINAAVNGKDKYNKSWVHGPSDYTFKGKNSWRNDEYSANAAMEKDKKDYKVKEFKKLGDKYQLNKLTVSDLKKYSHIVFLLESSIQTAQGLPPPLTGNQKIVKAFDDAGKSISGFFNHLIHPA